MTDPVAGYSTILKYAAGTLIGKMSSIGGVKLTAETIETTNHDSPDSYREFIGGLRDAGEFPMEGNFIQDDAGQLALMSSFESGVVESFVVVFPDLSEWEFNAVVTGVEIGKADLKDQLFFMATLKITGKPVFTAVTTLRTVTFTITETVGGSPIENAVVLFNNEIKLTNASGVAIFSNVADATYQYGVSASTFVGESEDTIVNSDEDVAVDLAAV